ncbi:MAG: DNA-directed DNA polymerase II small subunit [Nitrosopumilaceae archaeon]|nr:DNA-directed DNA polymerase II small subunit [Nitrosopumilaceae archaeon]NIU00889.1 DNA-directed DNA polymerase II small subunit [Nitrosopumilaceae archaeon]NIU87342.1 DNA-directed DNA polymerase II small subunit [Nitrosopumilaceae archaeon]NIV65870.1 DNA-directed DNA polymerase II small subunit [Nitrosopumilaceae archaeon]NIX61491.1 DNA-directed DNA polymerase II small subunit [Nitrosopumilaceae archaeon]
MKKEITYALDYALNKGFQIHPNAFRLLENLDVKQLEKIIKEIVREKKKQNLYLINQDDLELFLGIKTDETLRSDCQVEYDPTPNITSAEGVNGFGMLFSSRFLKLKQIILTRPEAKMLKPISSVLSEKSKNDTYVCGLVVQRSSERNVSKVTVEDPSGSMELVVFDKDLQAVADSLMVDQFVMARIVAGKNGGFIAKDLIFPDIPDHHSNRSETETYAVFLSDLHVGSQYFMEAELNALVSWLSEPDPIARKVRFLIIGGDVVDGVGIYPNQDKELVCQTVDEQLEKLERIISKIPKNIKVIISPGNHDPGRRALPQPALPQKYNTNLWSHENIILVGNPAIISLNGVKVLIFHGQSIDDIVKTTPGLSYAKPANVMRHLLRARHLSPIYGGQTPIAPEKEDMLTIDEVPDIFHVGHVHVVDLDLYKNILLINSGTWQKQTPFQQSVGVNPTPGIAVVVNLKTFKVYTKDFPA